jgi:hypothetical protein
LLALERVVERTLGGFFECATALAQIRAERLYRSTHRNFADYCSERWGLSLSRCNQLISAIVVAQNLSQAFPEVDFSGLNEHLLRPLSRVVPELQSLGWELACRLSDQPDCALITKVVATIREAIESGWKERTALSQNCTPGAGTLLLCQAGLSFAPGGPKQSGAHRILGGSRQSDQLGSLWRWAKRVSALDPHQIALSNDEATSRRQLEGAKALASFCQALIGELENTLNISGEC